jgi:protein-tyrosine phosphatase
VAASPEALSRVLLFRSFDPAADPEAEVPDPWYGGPGGFDEVLDMVERTTDGLVERLQRLI